jgi:hypothetical protein
VEQRKVAALAVSQIRWVDHDRDIVRLRCAFRPALLQAGAEGDSAGPPTSPGGGASPVPAAVSSKQAIVLDAWADAADEPAATAAIDELIQSLRLPRE